MENLVLIIDSREQMALNFTTYPSEVTALKTGDYSIKGFEDRFTVERKSLSDLIGSLTHDRERFFRELDRMQSFEFRRLMVIGKRSDVMNGNYRSMATPKAVIASLAVVEVRYGVPVVYVDDADEGARVVECWAYYFHREQLKAQGQPQAAQGTGEPQAIHYPSQQRTRHRAR